MDVGSEESSAAKGVPCRCSVLSDVGKRRQENQDSYGYVHTHNGSLFLVADGMGGAQGGATASALAIEVIGKRAINAAGELSPESLVMAIRLANTAIHEHAKSSDKLSGMGTTLVALAIFSDKAVVAHVGDSRIYLLKNDNLVQLTRDHTLVQELMDAGTISAEQAENHPISHMLTRSIGPTPNVDVELQIYPLPLTEGDRFLLCCDGLTNHVEDDEIQRILETKEEPKDAAEMFVELANQRGGSDNITVQLVEICSYEQSARKELPDGKTEFVTSSEIKFDDDLIPEMPELEASGGGEDGDNEGEERARANGEDTSGSAVDSILFGENPTTEEVREHEKRAEEKLRAADAINTALGKDGQEAEPTVEGELESKGDEGVEEEEDDEFSFLDEEQVVPEDEAKRLKQVQMVGVTVIAIAVVAVIFIVLGQTGQRTKLRDVGTEPQMASNAGVAPAVTDPGTAEPVQTAPVEPVTAPDPTEATTPESGETTSTIDVPEATVVGDPSTNGEATTTSAPSSGQTKPDGGWPSANIIPENTVENDVKTAQTGTGQEAVAAANRLENKKSVIKEKIDVRREIEDLNYRLALLTLPTQMDVVKRKNKLTAELGEINKELGKASTAETKDDSDLWKMRKTSIEAGNFLEVAKEVAPEAPSLNSHIQMYEAAKMLAGNAASAAEASPGDEELASRKNTLAKELETHKEKLVGEVTKTVEQKLKEQQGGVSDPFSGYVDETSLKSRKDKIERQLKVIDSLSWGLSMERLEQQVKIEGEKKGLEKRLWELGLKVSDEEEAKILKSIAEGDDGVVEEAQAAPSENEAPKAAGEPSAKAETLPSPS